MKREMKIIAVGFAAIYAVDLALCAWIMSDRVFLGSRPLQVLQGSIVLPFQVMGHEPVALLTSLGFLLIPTTLWVLARVKRSVKLLVAGLITFGLIWNLIVWIGCIFTNLS